MGFAGDRANPDLGVCKVVPACPTITSAHIHMEPVSTPTTPLPMHLYMLASQGSYSSYCSAFTLWTVTYREVQGQEAIQVTPACL